MNLYNIFISHAWRYSSEYIKVVKWLDEAQDEGLFQYKNYSVPMHDPLIDPNTYIGERRLKEMLREQIRPASKIIVISGMYVAHSKWIDFEIDTAADYGKYIIGVEPWGQERIPAKVRYNADKMVGWNKNSVIRAIIE